MGRAKTRQFKFSDLMQPTERQREAWVSTYTHRYVLYGGARGGGKSKFLRWWMVDFLMEQHRRGVDKARVMLACETYPDLRDRQITKIKTEFPEWLGQIKETKEDGLCFFLDEELGGGMIALRNLDKPEKYQSAEFAAIGVDELTKITKPTFDILRGSMRWPGISHTVFVGATNPGGIGHGWVKSLWIDRNFPIELRPRAHEFYFTQSLPVDNPYLDQTYWDELNSLPEDLRRAWVEGDWNVFAGQAFPAWSTEKHTCNPVTIPAAWAKWRAVDWGFDNPFCCLWLTRDPSNGRVYVYRELYGTGLTDREQARAILDATPPDETISTTYADPSMWARASQINVTSTADIYAQNGVFLTQADNDRLSGKRKVDRLLEPLPDGEPGIKVFRTCPNLIRTLPTLAYDKTRVEDVDTKQEDHAYDTLRYGLTAAREYIKPPDKTKKHLNPWVAVKGL